MKLLTAIILVIQIMKQGLLQLILHRCGNCLMLISQNINIQFRTRDFRLCIDENLLKFPFQMI